MPAKKGKKNASKKNLNFLAKKAKFEELMESFHCQWKQEENKINQEFQIAADEIRAFYKNKLAEIPIECHNMTMAEYLEYQKAHSDKCDVPMIGDILKECQKKKMMTTIKKDKHFYGINSNFKHRRSTSAPPYKTFQSTQNMMTPLNYKGKFVSENLLYTPMTRKPSLMSKMTVTPKFNPKAPIIKSLMRKPRAGEVVMSLAGSPLVNSVDEIAEKPTIILTLGKGKVINISEDTDISKVPLNDLDEQTLTSVKNAKKNLEKILN